MNKDRVVNMTQGNPILLLLTFSFPLLVGNLFQQVYSLADSVIVGQFVGAGGLAAVGATGPISFLFFSVCNGIGSGGGIITAQYFGSGQTERVKKAIANSAYLMLGASLFMGILAYIASPSVLKLAGTPENIMADAVIYMQVSCIGVPLIAVYNYASSMLRALGDSKTPLIFLIAASILNVILDILFVSVFKMGVFGAALATVLGQMTAGIGCLLFAFHTNPYFQLNRSQLAYDRNIFFSAARLGLPLALQWSLIAISSTALQVVVNSFGTVSVAAFTATNRIEMLVHQPFGSLSTALATYAGQNYGADRIDRVKKGLRDSGILMTILAVFLLVVMQLLGKEMVRAFVTDSEVIELGTTGLKITSWFYVFLGTINIIRGTMNGVGDALFAFINGIIEVICRIGIPLLVLNLTGIGVMGIWWAAALTWGVSALFCVLRYAAWRRKV